MFKLVESENLGFQRKKKNLIKEKWNIWVYEALRNVILLLIKMRELVVTGVWNMENKRK